MLYSREDRTHFWCIQSPTPEVYHGTCRYVDGMKEFPIWQVAGIEEDGCLLSNNNSNLLLPSDQPNNSSDLENSWFSMIKFFHKIRLLSVS